MTGKRPAGAEAPRWRTAAARFNNCARQPLPAPRDAQMIGRGSKGARSTAVPRLQASRGYKTLQATHPKGARSVPETSVLPSQCALNTNPNIVPTVFIIEKQGASALGIHRTRISQAKGAGSRERAYPPLSIYPRFLGIGGMPRTEQSAWSFWDRAGFACGSHPRTQPQSPEDAGPQNLTIWGRSWAVSRGPGPSPKRARLAPPERRDLLGSAGTRGFSWTPGTGHPSSALETSGCGVQSARVPLPRSALAASPPRPAPPRPRPGPRPPHLHLRRPFPWKLPSADAPSRRAVTLTTPPWS